MIRLKVEIRITPGEKEPRAVLFTDEITPEIRRAAAYLEGGSAAVTAAADEKGRIVVLRAEEIYMVRAENEKSAVYTRDKRYVSAKPLYAVENMLGSGFMRISRSTLVNLSQLDCVEPTLGGLMLLVLKNGCREYISRKYLPGFKRYLGL